MHEHARSIRNDAKMTAKTAEDVSIHKSKLKPPNSPTGTKIWCRGEADGLENVSDASIIRRDVHIDENDTKRAENVSKNIKHVK